MSKHLHQDLETLQKQVLLMAGYVEEAIHKSIENLRKNDKLLSRQVVDADDKVDDLDNDITEGCLLLLALHQPVAIDLRRVATILMITADLERMGDLATDIAERAAALAGFDRRAIPHKLSLMTDQTTLMLRQSLDAFVNHDSKMARAVIRMDDQVDLLNVEIIDELIVRMKSSSNVVEPSLSFFSAVRHLERIADHATNIAEDVLYLIDGEIVRHRPKAIAEKV